MKKLFSLIAIFLLNYLLILNIFAQGTEKTESADKNAIIATEDLSGSKTLTDEEYAKMAGGCVAPSPEEKQRLDSKAVKIEPKDIVPVNELGLQRINAERIRKGKKALSSIEANDLLLKKKQVLLKTEDGTQKINDIEE